MSPAQAMSQWDRTGRHGGVGGKPASINKNIHEIVLVAVVMQRSLKPSVGWQSMRR